MVDLKEMTTDFLKVFSLVGLMDSQMATQMGMPTAILKET